MKEKTNFNVEEIIKEFGYLFRVVKEPEYSKQKVIELQNKHSLSVNEELDLKYWQERFLRYGGKLEDL